MKTTPLVFLGALGLTVSCYTAPQDGERPVDSVAEEIIALERSALDRWIVANPDGYLELAAPDITYFDPNQEKRIDGLEAFTTLLAPIKEMQLPFTEPRYEMIAPKVQLYGDMALLTFNLVNFGKLDGASESVLARWNSSELYRRVGGQWMIVHSHWSYVKPAVQQPVDAKYVEENRVFLAEAGALTLGWCAVSEERGEYWLDYCWVLPEASGHGIGRTLVLRALGLAAELGLAALKVLDGLPQGRELAGVTSRQRDE